MIDAELKAEFERLHGRMDEVRADVAHVEHKVADILERLALHPTRDELFASVERTYDLATLKAEHAEIKRVMRERLHINL